MGLLNFVKEAGEKYGMPSPATVKKIGLKS